MEWKIELIFVPVSDVDRSKEFYERIGFHADHDQVPYEGLRFVQMTPPGS
ncbi:VOC family protein, partial [Microbacterium sp.]